MEARVGQGLKARQVAKGMYESKNALGFLPAVTLFSSNGFLIDFPYWVMDRDWVDLSHYLVRPFPVSCNLQMVPQPVLSNKTSLFAVSYDKRE